MSRSLVIPVLLVLMSAVHVAAPAPQAQFELDGNATVTSTAATDWASLYAGSGNFLAFTGIVSDPGQDTIFAGGPKDIQDMDKWTWKNNGGFPDKNDITNAFAAAYDANGELVVYFGADRFANTGDAYLGFWFFKDRVTLNQNGTFSTRHQVGDLLVLVNYPQGTSAQPEVQVLEWNPALQDVATNLNMLYSGTALRCGSVPPSLACAITNAQGSPSPWTYQPKAGARGTFPPESFFEGGVNLSALLGGTQCFSSFLAETRSSTSVTASLKDFVLGEFPVCGIDVTKTCEVSEFSGDFSSFLVDFTATVRNSGAGTFAAGSLVTVVDDAGTPGNSSDDVVVNRTLQAPMEPGDEVTVSGRFASTQNPPYNTVTAVVETQDAVLQAEAFGIDCEPMELSPKLAVSKLCSVVLESSAGLLVVRVDFTGSVQNTGNTALYVTVTDDLAGLVLPERLLLPGASVNLSGSYYPSLANGAVTDPGTAMFTAKFTATGRNPLLANAVIEVISASCSLCP